MKYRPLSNVVMCCTRDTYAISNSDGPMLEVPKGVALLANARGGFVHIAKNYKCENKRVLVPAYTCFTVDRPFTDEGWDCRYFALDRNMRMVPEAFLQQLETFRPDVVVVHPYYGQDLNEEEQGLLRKAKEMGCFIVEDLTLCMDSKRRYDFVDAYMGSLRKWLRIPDGAFYYSKVLPLDDSALTENTMFVQTFRDAQYARMLYLETMDPELMRMASRLYHIAEELDSTFAIHRMSDVTKRILHTVDFAATEEQRMKNCRYLWEKLKDHPNCTPAYKDISDVTTGPLWFPIYIKGDRDTFIAERFRPRKVSAIRMWKPEVENPPFFVSPEVIALYDNLLVLPMGLDYTEEDMQYMVDGINKIELK